MIGERLEIVICTSTSPSCVYETTV